MLEIGNEAPQFYLRDQDGNEHDLEAYRGRWVVLFFYPKDDTSGCTKEACSFRDHHADLRGLDAVVFGFSADDEKSHATFAAKYSLTYPLLVDPDKTTLEAYGAWVEKTMYGKKYLGVQRITYLIDPEGKIAHVWPKVKPEDHALEVKREIETRRRG
ncbi:MAG: peroxiredoxin [Trueperaceae bacterium]|nr:MAG: peroxiredoxin [Trueperaceae bacterium]